MYNDLKVKVVDAPCGHGKTQWAIQYMNGCTEKKFIFITPYLDEVARVKRDCPERKFKEPGDKRGSKAADLKRLLTRGENIASTHALFLNVDDETAELIEMGGYVLIMDEVGEVVKEEHLSKDDLTMLVETGILVIDDETNKVAVTDKYETYKGKFDTVVKNAALGRLIHAHGSLLIWQFPIDIFDKFREVYNLTYLFGGQLQKYYYDLHQVPMEILTVTEDGFNDDGETLYKLIPHQHHDDSEFKEMLRKKINLYVGPQNNIADKEFTLSWSWYQKATPAMLKTLKNATYNYFRNIIGGKSKLNMWTCFKDKRKQVRGDSYARGFIAHNARATNKYREKENLAYLVNRFPRKPLLDYFRSQNVAVDEEMYALSELIQWIWRSAIRDKKPINLFVPSSRMRGLLQLWLGLPVE